MDVNISGNDISYHVEEMHINSKERQENLTPYHRETIESETISVARDAIQIVIMLHHIERD